MGIGLGLILRVIAWLEHLADVMEVRADSRKQAIGTDGTRACLGERAHNLAVMIGPRALEGHSLQQWMIEIAELEDSQLRRSSEDRLE